VVRTWGSAPVPVGSQLVVDAQGAFQGSVSGGCIEGDVVTQAMDVIASGTQRLLAFSVADETAWEVGLSCGGEIEVFVAAWRDDDAHQAELLARLERARASKETVGVVTRLTDGAQSFVGNDAPPGHVALDAALMPEIDGHLQAGRSARLDATRFLRVYSPPLRLILVGAVHVSQALVPMARQAGFEPVVVDPRTAFATPDRFPGVELITDWPDVALEALAPDQRTAVVTLTHDPKLDEPALAVALASPAFYVGSLGSRKTHAKRLARLREAGIDAALFPRIHAPIGLPLGGRRPAEIAVSILAEIIMVLNGGEVAARRA
jgi:xanthine dehydrogenase accessory factor